MVTRQVNKWGEGGRLRDDLLEAATRLLSRASSRDAVTLRAIAREAGVAAPSIYKHFADRDAVIDAVVAGTFQQLDAVCEQAYRDSEPGPARVRAISRAYVAFAVDRPHRYRVLFERSGGTRSAAPGLYPSGMHAFQYLTEAIREAGDGDTAFRDAEVLWAALHGVVTLVPSTPDFPWTPTESIVDAVLDRFVPVSG